jgi:hypothetical protein
MEFISNKKIKDMSLKFSQELVEKMQELNAGQEVQGLLTELKNQTDIYLSKLNFKQSKN